MGPGCGGPGAGTEVLALIGNVKSQLLVASVRVLGEMRNRCCVREIRHWGGAKSQGDSLEATGLCLTVLISAGLCLQVESEGCISPTLRRKDLWCGDLFYYCAFNNFLIFYLKMKHKVILVVIFIPVSDWSQPHHLYLMLLRFCTWMGNSEGGSTHHPVPFPFFPFSNGPASHFTAMPQVGAREYFSNRVIEDLHTVSSDLYFLLFFLGTGAKSWCWAQVPLCRPEKHPGGGGLRRTLGACSPWMTSKNRAAHNPWAPACLWTVPYEPCANTVVTYVRSL